MSFQLCYIKLSHTRVYHPLKSPFKNYKLSASFHSVHIFPISPSSTSTEVVEDGCFDHSLNWFDQPTAFQRANMQRVSESHPFTFSTYTIAHFDFPRLPFLLWWKQCSRPGTSTYYSRGCAGTKPDVETCAFTRGRGVKGCYLLLRWEVGLKQSTLHRKNYSSLMLFQGEGTQLNLQLWQIACQMLIKIPVFFF